MTHPGDLPLDIILDILSRLDLQDVRNFRSVDKSSNEAAEQTLWARQTIQVHIRDEVQLEAGLQKLEEFRKNPVSAGKIQLLDVQISIKDEEGVEMLKEAGLSEALCTLQGLKSVRWGLTPSDLKSIQEAIIRSLAALPMLSKVYLQANFASKGLPPIPLDLFRNGKLDVLSVDAGFVDGEHLISSLSNVLQQNPHITQLHLNSNLGAPKSPLRFAEIFSRSLAQPLKLEQLSIQGSWSMENPVFVAHFRNLTSLKLSVHRDPAFWEALRSSSVHLRHLTTCMNDEILDYLSSYSGLEELNMPSLDLLPSEESVDTLAERFYERVLQKHSETLNHLRISICNTRSWCFGPWNVYAFDNCGQLEFLRIGIHEEEIFETDDPEKHLLSTLVRQVSMLPKFRLLYISPVYSGRGGVQDSERGTILVDRVLQNVRLTVKELPRFDIAHARPYGGSRLVFYFPEMVRQDEVRFTTLRHSRG